MFTSLQDKIFFEGVTFEFLGFRGTCFDLQRAGWDFTLSERQSLYQPDTELVFFMKHGHLGLMGVSKSFRRSFFTDNLRDRLRPADLIVSISSITTSDTRLMSPAKFNAQELSSEFKHTPIDFSESYGMPIRAEELYRGIPFAKVNLENNFEIYLNKKDEQELMGLILDKQVVKQKEIRQNEKRRDYLEIKKAAPGALLKII